MRTKSNDVVEEYLREVDQRLAGIPVLQRRELLADLRTHIETERAERNLHGEGELIEVLERLGSPEVVAAAAHEEAEAYRAATPVPQRPRWHLVAAVVTAVVVVLFCLFAMFATVRGGETGPAPAYPVQTEDTGPAPTR